MFFNLIKRRLQSSLSLDETALKKLRELKKKYPHKTFRVSVEGGGCHGFQYKFSLEEGENQELLMVDEVSRPFLRNAKLVFREDMMGSAFVVEGNEVEEGGCGCGVSFSVKE